MNNMTKKEKDPDWWKKYTKKYLEDVEKENTPVPKKTPHKHTHIHKHTHKPRNLPDEPRYFDLSEELERFQGMIDKTFKGFNEIFKENKPSSPFRIPRIPIFNMEGKTFRQPFVQVKETQKQVIVRIELPGMKKVNINIRVEGRNLIISAQSTQNQDMNQKFGINYRGFRTIVKLPADVDKTNSKARFDQGILEITLSKTTPSDGPSEIDIE